jgi:anti-anti-sigma factor
MNQPDLPPVAGTRPVAAGVPRDSGNVRLEIVVRSEHRRHRVVPYGEIDLATTGQLERVVLRLLQEGGVRVVLDLSALDFIDLAGLRGLRRCRDYAARTGVPFYLIPGRREPHRLLTLCRLLGEFELAPLPPAQPGSQVA